eukprot:9267728-Pyramimonas_sp.AAC.1
MPVSHGICNLNFLCLLCHAPASHSRAVLHASERREAEAKKRLEITEAGERDIAEMREQFRQSELQQRAAAALQLERDREANAMELLEERQLAVAAGQALAATIEMREFAHGLEAAAAFESHAQLQGQHFAEEAMRVFRGLGEAQHATMSDAAQELQAAEDRNARLAAEAAADVTQSESDRAAAEERARDVVLRAQFQAM